MYNFEKIYNLSDRLATASTSSKKVELNLICPGALERPRPDQELSLPGYVIYASVVYQLFHYLSLGFLFASS